MNAPVGGLMWVRLALVVAIAALLTGCTSTAMRGTTLYTHEYGMGGTSSGRIAAFPLVYYSSPTLSVIWPLFETSPSYTVFRPLFSAYRDRDSKAIYSVLWPLAQFDREARDNRIFPVFWGADYACVLPLYWHYRSSPGDAELVDTLIPLWVHWRRGDESSTHVLWPVFNRKHSATESGWRIWPFYGSYHGGWKGAASSYRFFAWPLGHQWDRSASGSRGTLLVPLYAALHDRGGNRFLSLPVSFGDRNDGSRWMLIPPLCYRSSDKRDSRFVTLLGGAGRSVDGRNSWSCVLPLYLARKQGNDRFVASLPVIYSRDAERALWLAPLLLSGGYRNDAGREWWALAPLIHSSRFPEGTSRHALPLFYYRKTPGHRLLLSLPWCSGSSAQSHWQAVPLLFLRQRGAEGDRLLTPLYAHGVSADGARRWRTVLPLFFSSQTPDGRLLLSLPWCSGGTDQSRWQAVPLLFLRQRGAEGDRLLTPLYAHRVSADGARRWRTVLPLFFSSQTPDRRLLLSLPWCSGGTGQSRWQAVPLLYLRQRNGERDRLLTPLYAHSVSADGARRWRTVLPLFFSSQTPDGRLLLSLPWCSGGTALNQWQFVPLLYLRHKDQRGDRLFTPLYAQGTSADGSRRWQTLVPFFYHRATPERHLTVTLLGGRDVDADGRSVIIYPLLSGGRARKDGTGNLWIVAPLFHASWGTNGVTSHLLPLYFRNASDGRIYSPFLAKWQGEGGERHTLIPPLLSFYRAEPTRRDLWALGGLGHASWGPDRGSQHLFPLFYRNSAGSAWVSPVAAKWKADNGAQRVLIPPLLSLYQGQSTRRDLWALGGLGHASWGPDHGSRHLIPLFYRNATGSAWVSPVAAKWKADSGAQRVLIPPLLSLYQGQPTRRDLWALGGLGHASWGPDHGSRHLIPLFYSDAARGLLLSPLVSKWRNREGSRSVMVPAALSWLTTSPDRRDLWMLGPLAHTSWGTKRGSSHVFPLFYRNPGKAMITPLAAAWQGESGKTWLYPLLLSRYNRDGGAKRLDMLLGLGSERWGDRERNGYFFPLYMHMEGRKAFYSLLFGWDRRDEKDGIVYPLTPLMGVRTGRHRGGWFLPFFSRDRDLDSGTTHGSILWGSYSRERLETRSSLFPFYGYRNRQGVAEQGEDASSRRTSGKTFWCLPACWYNSTTETLMVAGQERKTVVKRSGVFPFWIASTTQAGDREHSWSAVLGLLYDAVHEVTPAEGGQSARDYTRRRVLWRMWHYVRENESVSVDVFPGMTYDRNPDGTKTYAFLSRVFRYERSPEGTKVYVFFVPVRR